MDESDDTVHYNISLSNGITLSTLKFYHYPDAFKEFASRLLSFPKTIDETVIFEVGEDDEKWAYYMLLKVFCYEVNGHTAIQIIIDDHGKGVDKNKTEFYIKTLPASINKLGELLINWDPSMKKEFIW